MERLEILLRNLPDIRPARELSAHVLAAVAEARERRRVFREMLFGALAALSALALVSAVMHAAQSFSGSTFASYFSLVFTDSGVALTNWQAVLLSLVESMPLTALTLVAAAAFAFLASLKAAGPYVRPQRGLSYGA